MGTSTQHRLCHKQELISRPPFCFWEICAVVRGGPGGTRYPRKSFGGAALLYKHCLSVFFWPLRPFSLIVGKGTGCALVWPRPSAGSSRIACSNGHMSRPQRPTAHAPAAAAAAALGHIYLSAHSSAKRTRQSSKRKWESATERSIRESGGDVGFELLKINKLLLYTGSWLLVL